MFLARTGERLKAELEAAPDENSIAADLYKIARGEMTEITRELMLLRVSLMERAAGVDTAGSNTGAGDEAPPA